MSIETKEQLTTGQKQTLQRHLVRLDENMNPTDKCLCGHIWDKLHPKAAGQLCEECLEVLENER
jgi:hypothetical protein